MAVATFVFSLGCAMYLGGKTAGWAFVLTLLVLQLALKSFRLLLTLLTLEALMVFTALTWATCAPAQGVPSQLLLVFFMVSVSEAALALSLLVSFVRSRGNDSLQSGS